MLLMHRHYIGKMTKVTHWWKERLESQKAEVDTRTHITARREPA